VVPIAGEAATIAKIAAKSEKYLQALDVVTKKVLPHLPASVARKLEDAIAAARKKIEEIAGTKPMAKAEPEAPPKAKDEGKNGAKVKGDPCQPLENGVPGDGHRGGKHGKIKAGGYSYDPKRESHHVPANSTYDKIGGHPISSDGKPTIQMDKVDHVKTASWGGGNAAKAYRKTQAMLMRSGKAGFVQAVMMDITDIRAKFGSKYDAAIVQYLAWSKCKGYL